MATTAIGRTAEDRARSHLEALGLRLLYKNYRRAGGEVDLIMVDHSPLHAHERVLVFVEVKFRTHSGYGGAAAAVTPQKQARLAAAAHAYVSAHPYVRDWVWRFDVVTIVGRSVDAGELTWIKRAF